MQYEPDTAENIISIADDGVWMKTVSWDAPCKTSGSSLSLWHFVRFNRNRPMELNGRICIVRSDFVRFHRAPKNVWERYSHIQLSECAASARKDQNMLTILVVEDDFLIREFISDELADAGFAVLQVGNADEAIAVLEARQDIHFLFTDIDMPGSIDGLKLAAFVSERWPPVEIIVTSGKHEAPPLPERIIFIPKPYQPLHIVHTIKAKI